MLERAVRLELLIDCARERDRRPLVVFGVAKVDGRRLGVEAVASVRIRYGDLALQRGEYSVAEAHFGHDLAWFEEHQAFWGLITGLDGLGCVASHRGELLVARERFGRALAVALACKANPLANYVAAGVALVVARSGDPARAVELLARARSDSATERRTHSQRIDPLLAELEPSLPPDEFAAALDRGKSLDLDALAEELSESSIRPTAKH
jgi:hypothetical protein